MSKQKSAVLFVSFAPNHSSHHRRLQDISGAAIDLTIYKTRSDKNIETLLQRTFKLTYIRLFFVLLFSKADVFWLWGIDACLVGSVAKIVRRKKTIIWDISDINPHFLGKSLKARFFRAIERTLLPTVNWLLLTSPEFLTQYYSMKLSSTKVEVIENLLAGQQPSEVPSPPDLAKFKIVYTGIFRSVRALQIIAEVASALPEQVEFNLYGFCSNGAEEAEYENLKSLPNVTLHGKYDMRDLHRIHAENHLIFGLLDKDADDNERWLLPNRIYHAGAFRRPILTNRGTFTAKVVEQRRLGYVCDFSASSVIETIRMLTADGGRRYKELTSAIPADGDYYLSGHYRRFIEIVTSPSV
ncbi:hypothetical protein TSA1_32200 [Bradyrhizobium nitroreducens]|uniref:Glycosyl transferase family 1 domain-containing protein n=1 Tax=Bradyrhizobium nitroreducens TaxID=709803 RepID=A0A2M6UJZ6_9BRAD|nr:hypothetical protein [Bradyrhizobium nitroreducens]PIT04889.1 hypothetical protein TSA1_32200 [Bradyrhizobium nitroreducens]